MCCLQAATGILPAQDADGSTLPPSYDVLAQEGARRLAAEGAEFYTTQHHPSAHGMSVSFKYPRGWKTESGVKPFIQSFTSPADDFLIDISCQHLDLPAGEVHTPEKAEFILSVNSLKRAVGNDATFIESYPARLDGHPAVAAEYSKPLKLKSGKTLTTTTTGYYFIWRGYLVLFEASFFSKDQAEAAQRQRSPAIAEKHALFHAMALPLRIDDHNYENHTRAPVAATTGTPQPSASHAG
ncbi:MAG TPA: hypothetical protein VGE39_17265, partial [Prosthecobacter sp.]